MNLHGSTIDSLIAFDEAFHILRRTLAAEKVSNKLKAQHLTWLDRCEEFYLCQATICLRVFKQLPAASFSAPISPQIERWYWCVGSRGLVHEFLNAASSATIVSSRQSHRSEDRKRWFRKFLHAAQAIDSLADWWLIFPNIATGPLSEHVAKRCEMKSVRCETLTWTSLLERLHANIDLSHLVHSDHRQLDCYITEVLAPDRTDLEFDPRVLACPPQDCQSKLCDSLSVHLPQRIHVIDVRSGGNIDRLVSDRLQQDQEQTSAVRIYRTLDERANAHQRLCDAGAIDWLVLEPSTDHATQPAKRECKHSGIANPIFNVQLLESSISGSEWPYLTHCTRARLYEWSDQSLSPEWDRWLIQGLPDETSPWETLVHIATSQRLIAAPDMTRNKIPTVSFSAVPLTELLSRRTYRSHMRRWDWEPYGVCIAKAVLARWQARAVIYGDEETWNRLSSEDQPWFQPRFSRTGKIDWQEEREWRVLGDVRLRKFPWETVFFFVPTQAEALELSQISRWPVAVVGK